MCVLGLKTEANEMRFRMLEKDSKRYFRLSYVIDGGVA
jgi:hypothetical protein